MSKTIIIKFDKEEEYKEFHKVFIEEGAKVDADSTITETEDSIEVVIHSLDQDV